MYRENNNSGQTAAKIHDTVYHDASLEVLIERPVFFATGKARWRKSRIPDEIVEFRQAKGDKQWRAKK
uniref:Uncharacterized protein n=1 Tax=Candidatus Kentrum sp. SD TaxID=2126332 RepID=A0A451BIS0_9GAMM|nr:MAG: hypothetical protein BECKSD772D_GA0070982_10097 [Candidatus Kentron sp. SD]